jgi:hypothetical protein
LPTRLCGIAHRDAATGASPLNYFAKNEYIGIMPALSAIPAEKNVKRAIGRSIINTPQIDDHAISRILLQRLQNLPLCRSWLLIAFSGAFSWIVSKKNIMRE